MDPSKPDSSKMPDGPPDGDAEHAWDEVPPGGEGHWYRSVVENSSEVVSIVDPDGTLRYASPAWKRVLGYDPWEVVGKNVLDHVHPDDLHLVLEETEKALLEEGIITNKAEYRRRHKDGSWRWVESVGTYLLDNPDIRGVVVHTRDITERKEAEEALQGSEAEIFSVLESITDAFFALDKEWRFAYVNTQAEALFGRAREDLVGERIREDPTFYPEYRKAVAEGRTASFEAHYPPTEAWYSVRAYPSTTGLSVYLQDVTQRKEAEERIRLQSRLLDAVGQAVIATDVEGRVFYWNRRAEELYGWTAEEVMGRPVVDFGVSEDLRSRAAEIIGEIRTGKTWSGEFVVRRKDGDSVPVMATDTPVYDELGNLSGIIGVSTDLSERKAAEEALKESEERYRRQSRDLSLLHRVRTALVQELDLRSVFHVVVEAIAETYGYTQVSAYLLEGEDLVLQHQVGYERVIERIPITEGVSGRAIRDGKPVLVEDVSADRDFLGAVAGLTSEICVPLFDEGEAVGFVNVESKGGAKLTQDDLDLMVTLGDHVGVAVGRARLYTQVRRDEKRLRSLADSAFEGILITERGEILEVNRALADMLGYGLAEIAGRSALEFVAPEHRDLVWRKISSGDKDPYEIVGLKKDGTLLDLEVRGRAFSYQGRSVRVTAVRDITEHKAAEERLRKAEQRYRALVERVPAVVYVQEIGGPDSAVYMSPRIEDLTGYIPEECRNPDLRWRMVHPEDRERMRSEDERTVEPGEVFANEYRVLHRDGHTVWVRNESVVIEDEAGGTRYWQGFMVDITERKRAEEALRQSERRFRRSFEDAAVGMALVGTDGRWLRVNRSLCEIVGYTREALLEKTFQDITHPEDLERDLEQVQRLLKGEKRSYQMEKRYLHKDGHVVWILLNVSLVHGEEGESLYFIAQVQDITERKRMENQLQRQALQDPLTGLPNRKLLEDRLGQALERTRRREDRRVAVLFMDLDDFKVVNDSLGHEAGDLLLKVVAWRLGRCLRPEDSLSRFGGDEFVLLLPDVGGPHEAVRVAERVTEELRRPLVLEGRDIFVSVSIGIALGDARRKSPEDLLRDADTAMYRAKDEGLGYRVFAPAMYEGAMRRLDLENDLKRSAEAEEFIVHYQPIVDLGTGGAWGVEALVRWQHPKRGLLEPSEFMPVVEESGLIVPVGKRILRAACRQAKLWREDPRLPRLVMCVNVSAVQLRRSDLARTVEEALRDTGMEASHLSLDVTESTYIKVLEARTATLDRLKALGVRMSLDDFGTGYSSLSYLKSLPADAIKIDKSFVKGLGEDAEDTAIVRMIVELAHTLGMEVVAEGVESEEQSQLLREMGCDMAQGFHFAKPLPAEDVPGILAG